MQQAAFRRRGPLILIALGALAGCSILASREVFEDWGPAEYRRFETFANKSLKEEPERHEKTVASAVVPWSIDPNCRNRFPAKGDEPPSRSVIEAGCTGPRRDGDFVSVSISGGGTKSAVFSAEAMFALQAWGLLPRVDAISSVSGGSFTAALYALSCDAENCDPLPGGRPRILWEYDNIMPRAGADVMFSYAVRRFNLLDLMERGTTHRNAASVLAEVIGDRLFDESRIGRKITFADLNPRRPNLILNATNTTRYRRYLEEHVHVIEGRPRRLLHDSERSHFSFVDYYFRDLLHSNLSTYPLAYGVTASAAFPLIIDYVTLGRFADPVPEDKQADPVWAQFQCKARRATGECISFVHLTDGGAHDNHGILEIALILEEIMGERQATANPVDPPRRVLSLVLDSSVIGSTGTDDENPSPRRLHNAVLPLRPLNVSEAIDRTMDSNAGHRKRAFQRHLEERKKMGRLSWARTYDVGLEPLDRWGGPLPDKDARWRTADKIADPAFRARFGLAPIHPQCLYDALAETPTSFELHSDVASCLRHAARWAVAQRMIEICRDEELNGDRFGIDCLLIDGGTPQKALGPLPVCHFGKLYSALGYFNNPVLEREYESGPNGADPVARGLCTKL